ncbi:hypothetical protein ABZ759_31790 [Streptomyces sp. NPDC047860]|uniref:hypothetical protein n=1 Tax=Streptomyces sp. NPDC047860 TaxID=3155743 RepID=UPI0033E4BCD3
MKEEWQELLVGTWQLSVGGEAVENSCCYTFTREGKFSVKALSGSFLQDALVTAAGDGNSGRWRAVQAADQVVLQMWVLSVERGLMGLLDPKWLKPAVFALGRLHPPEEWLLVSAEKEVIDVRVRPAYRGRKETSLQLVRRRGPV